MEICRYKHRAQLGAPPGASGQAAGGKATGGKAAGGKAAGFTLIELMMVLVLIAILLSLTGPGFQESLRNNRLQTSFNNVVSALSFARSEAVVRSQPVAVCPTTDTASCGGANWETGYLVFVDNGEGGGTPQDGILNGGEELLRIVNPAPNGVTVRSLGFNAVTNVVFQVDGRVLQNNRGTFTICDTRGAADARALVVEVSGQARFAADANSDGTLEDHNASAVVCP